MDLTTESSIPAPPFADREAAAAAMYQRYTEHNDLLRVGGPSLDQLSRTLLDKQNQARQLEREIGALECQIKEKIGLFRGLKTRVGTWLWEKWTPATRFDYKGILLYLNKHSPEVLKQFARPASPTRILRFERGNSQPWPIKTTKTKTHTPAEPDSPPRLPPDMPRDPADPVPGDR